MSDDHDDASGAARRFGERLSDVSWLRWPEALAEQGRLVLDELRTGRPHRAEELLDELASDVLERRATLADSANRRFEPSTDDRNP